MIVVFQKTIKSVIISFSFIICKCCSLHYFIWSCGKTFLITTYFSVRFGPAALMRCVQLGNSTLLRFLIMKVDSHLDQLIRIIWNNSKKDNDTSVGVIRCFNKLLFFLLFCTSSHLIYIHVYWAFKGKIIHFICLVIFTLNRFYLISYFVLS